MCTCRAGRGLLAGGWDHGFVRRLTRLVNVSPRDHRIQGHFSAGPSTTHHSNSSQSMCFHCRFSFLFFWQNKSDITKTFRQSTSSGLTYQRLAPRRHRLAPLRRHRRLVPTGPVLTCSPWGPTGRRARWNQTEPPPRRPSLDGGGRGKTRLP